MRDQSSARDLLFIGVKGSVVALDGKSGNIVWETPLKGSSFVNVTREGDRILASTYGEVYCLDPATGDVLWHNRLKGFGYGMITFATATPIPAAAEQLASEEAAVAATTTTTAST